jgi:Holliday junction resolvasome RuvABC endonuclease subunit
MTSPLTSNVAYVGLDMSLKSPAVCVFCNGIWQLYCFSQKKTKVTRYIDVKPNVSIVIFPTIPKDASDAKRYKHIIDFLIPVIPPKSHVSIEAYAYPSRQQAGSNFKLHELGGVLKFKLSELELDYTSIVASSWKKQTVGKGNATKKDVLDHVLNYEPHVDLLKILNLQLKKNDDVPCPAQDLADSICIVKAMSLNKNLT